MDIPFDSTLRCQHISAAVAYGVLAALFAIAVKRRWRKGRVSLVLAGVLILVPAIYYPVLYFVLWRDKPLEAQYVQLLGELWGPLWAALSGLWLAILFEVRPWKPKSGQ